MLECVEDDVTPLWTVVSARRPSEPNTQPQLTVRLSLMFDAVLKGTSRHRSFSEALESSSILTGKLFVYNPASAHWFRRPPRPSASRSRMRVKVGFNNRGFGCAIIIHQNGIPIGVCFM